MQKIKRFFTELWLDERGQGLAEYGLVMAFIAAVILGVYSLLG
ncbi:MAG: Flp family type IVb pilin [Firmicutes bacterium]|nr:Flp family type IVb pilin [Bacillota bacterium]